ncbi:MAG: mannose-6-phosphate isomerase, class I [Oscillospiraceae bacterium]|nr:mannose-6-phosphate isomerase, class I [Oscillospiraceae bacterium]
MKLIPAVSSTIWGGRRLIDEYGVKTDEENAAEAWVLACHKNGRAVIGNGEHAGKTLEAVFKDAPGICGKNGERFKEFPILIKFIDARDNLSIQVHPDEEYAQRVENGAGKTECWYILDCDEDAELILGFEHGVSKEEFRQSISDGTLLDDVRKVKVKKGDFFFIEAGTLHAICKGVLLAEVQQNSDTTYRIYDYNRKNPDGTYRELHIDQAVDVTKRVPYRFDSCKVKILDKQKKCLVECKLFSLYRVDSRGEYESRAGAESFVSLLVLDGEGKLSCSGERMNLRKGDSIFIPANAGDFTVTGDVELLETRI